ncbi:MAG: cobalamin B12-binding domain-containing protein [Deltaproteobacteria bacterium]|nr:cobalamin B12-binding domain-containing protein [Deltaproteobacteria bacterium]
MTPGSPADRPVRVLVAKPGLDGHDKGAKVVARALRDAGMEVIYSGLHQTVEQVVNAALQEAVDVIGLSILSGAHLTLCQKLRRALDAADLRDVIVVVGGVIPGKDAERLKALGIDGVFPGGADLQAIAEFIHGAVAARRAREAG